VVPATNPRFATVIVINDPQAGKFYGGLVSAPVYHNVMEGTLRLMDVPLDDLQSWLAAQQSGKVGHSASILPAPPAEPRCRSMPPLNSTLRCRARKPRRRPLREARNESFDVAFAVASGRPWRATIPF
jgi:hypothetical protein